MWRAPPTSHPVAYNEDSCKKESAQISRDNNVLLSSFSSGVRPFGVSLLVAGWDDDRPYLFQCDPSVKLIVLGCIAGNFVRNWQNTRAVKPGERGAARVFCHCVPMKLPALQVDY